MRFNEMDRPLITIGIPFYNAEKYLLGAIKSILAQTVQDWELILVDDGSTDKSLDIAKSILDPRIRIVSDGRNKRLPARLNQVVDIAKGKYIARMDADDLCSPTRIEEQVNFLEQHPEIDLVGTGIIYLSETDEILGSKILPEKHAEICKQPYRTFGLCHASIVARKEWYVRNKYNERAIQAEDFNLWLKSYERSNFSNINKPLYYYRCEASSTFRKRLRCRYTSMKFLFLHYFENKKLIKAIFYSLLQLIKFIAGNLICFFMSRRRYIERRYVAVVDDTKRNIEEDLSKIKSFRIYTRGNGIEKKET